MRLFRCQSSCRLKFLYGSNAVAQCRNMRARTHTHTWKDMSKLLGTCCDYVNAPENEQNMPQHKVYLSTSKSGLNTFQNI